MKSNSVYVVEDLKRTRLESVHIQPVIPYPTQDRASALQHRSCYNLDTSARVCKLIDSIEDVSLQEGKYELWIRGKDEKEMMAKHGNPWNSYMRMLLVW